MFQPAVLVSFVEGERSATLTLSLGTFCGTVFIISSTEVSDVCTPVVNIVFGTYLESYGYSLFAFSRSAEALTSPMGTRFVLISRAAQTVSLNHTAVTLGTLRFVVLLLVRFTTVLTVVVDVGMGSRTLS